MDSFAVLVLTAVSVALVSACGVDPNAGPEPRPRTTSTTYLPDTPGSTPPHTSMRGNRSVELYQIVISTSLTMDQMTELDALEEKIKQVVTYHEKPMEIVSESRGQSGKFVQLTYVVTAKYCPSLKDVAAELMGKPPVTNVVVPDCEKREVETTTPHAKHA